MSSLRSPLISWLVAAAITAALGWPVVRFLPLYASIPFMVILVAGATFYGLFCGIMGRPNDTNPAVRLLFWLLVFLLFVSPTAIALGLFFT